MQPNDPQSNQSTPAPATPPPESPAPESSASNEPNPANPSSTETATPPKPSTDSPEQPAQKAPSDPSKEPKKKLDLKGEIKLSDIKKWFKSHKKELTAETTGNYEINLVPDVKSELNHTIRTRNLVLFICLIISVITIGGAGIIWSVIGGQSLVMSNQDTKLDLMSKKLNSFSSLNELLTIQDQVSKIATINDNRKLLSRVFTVLDAMRPRGADTVSYSEVNVTMNNNTINIEAQANAGEDPYIDYRVLESYKKNSLLMKYDYGRYVTAEGDEIPTRCIKEVDDYGNAYMENGRYFAYWTKDIEGCNPSAVAEEDEEGEGSEEDEAKSTTINLETPSLNTGLDSEQITTDSEQGIYELTDKIYRTPLIATGGGEWYEKEFINDSGEIQGVAHFASSCITYSAVGEGKSLQWTAENECMVTDSGVEITESSNGRDDNEELVLRFEGSIQINPEVLNFNNKHMMIINPSARNVTDSYVQVEGMFVKPAADCLENDTDCNSITDSGEEE